MVLSVVREATDKDYIITVLTDCCAEMDLEARRLLTTKIFPCKAEVRTAAEWSSNLQTER